VPACLAITAIKTPAQELLARALVGVMRQPASFLKIYVSLLTYWAIVGIAADVRQRRLARERERRAQQLETELARAELDALRMRLNPHFLFNTLNGISALMRENVEAADLMLTRLSELLRLTLDRANVQEVTLRDELDFVEQFAAIQRLRLGDRLTITVDAPADTWAVAVPALSLQPLVENALKHGAERTPGPARVSIVVRRRDGVLDVEVSDDGPGPADAARAGTGLDTTRRRLQHLYGDRGRLTLEPAVPRGAIARLSIPAREIAS
jgi:LytS/YehU family sensor histidine kinase